MHAMLFYVIYLGPSLGSRPNPLVMSELRRQREMFEQNKKLKFVEKQRRIRDSGDDNRSDGGTYSIRSDLDEGVGHSMFSADVTTAATWGGSTEQSSSEEDSAVGEEDFPEEEVEVYPLFYMQSIYIWNFSGSEGCKYFLLRSAH